MKLTSHLKSLCAQTVFPQEVLDWITSGNLWNIWVPEAYDGLESTFSEGLQILKGLAKADGSLGWTVTLCSGANYFIGNLEPEIVAEIFSATAILGGSGGMFGTAEKKGNQFVLSGKWRYATGANYLTHFTLNAKIIENDVELKNEDGSPKFLSFVIPANKVSIIEDWKTMGLKASVTHSFEVENVVVDQKNSFVYNRFYLPQDIFKIHFSLFADMTLWVNYIGMAEHFAEESSTLVDTKLVEPLKEVLSISNKRIESHALEVESVTAKNEVFTDDYIKQVHQEASKSVKDLSKEIIKLFPLLGVKASREDHVLNHIFRDYFTATQHHIFSRKA